LSFGLITGDDAGRKDKEHILTLIAFFDGKEISDTLFTPYGVKNREWMTSCIKNNAWSVYEFQDILRELQELSLLQGLQILPHGASFSVHPLVQDWIRIRGTAESCRSYAIESILVLGEYLYSRDIVRMSLEAKQTALTHLEAVLSNEQEYVGQDYCLADVNILAAIFEFAYLDELQGRYMVSEKLYQLVLEGRRRLLGDGDPLTLSAMSHLARALESQGKYEEVEPLYRQVLG
jgi:tetratricopeptide (TPR) repeat protein